MTLTLSTVARENLAASTAFLAQFDSGFIKFYTVGSGRPAGPGTAISDQTLLATLGLAATAITAGGSDGIVTFAAISSDVSIDATGTPTWCRFLQSNGTTAIIDAKVGTSGADINFDSVTWLAGGTAAITSLTLTMPAGTAD